MRLGKDLKGRQQAASPPRRRPPEGVGSGLGALPLDLRIGSRSVSSIKILEQKTKGQLNRLAQLKGLAKKNPPEVTKVMGKDAEKNLHIREFSSESQIKVPTARLLLVTLLTTVGWSWLLVWMPHGLQLPAGAVLLQVGS